MASENSHSDPRKAYCTEEAPLELVELLDAGLDRIIKGASDENDS
jgi:hypothetical protein